MGRTMGRTREQIPIVCKDLRGYDLLHEGTLALSDLEENGLRINKERVLKQMKNTDERIKEINEKLGEYKEIQLWKRLYGKKFKISSNKQLSEVLYKHLGIKANSFTSKGNVKTDKNVLQKLNKKYPFIEDILELRDLQKSGNTYLKNFLREQWNEVIHPSFNLHLVRTFRSSSQNPNFQNIPVRKEGMKKLIRSSIIPRKDHLLIEIDYKALEVRIAACYHKDPNMIDEIVNPARDMHRDMAMEIYKLKPNEWTELARYYAKNKFVFPEFYGDYYESCAKNLWEPVTTNTLVTLSGEPMRDHLKKVGIQNYDDFEDHLKKVEDRFWNVRFPVYTKWKKKQIEKYYRNGFITMHTGFRCSGLMKRNEVINYPVQGAAFHCLLWSVIHLNKIFKKLKMDSMIVGQIHDSMILDVHPEEYNKVLNLAYQVMTEEIRKVWEWIIVPLDIEIEVSIMNRSWYEKKKVIRKECPVCKAMYVYKNKPKEDTKKIIWECPLCGDKTEEYKEVI